MPTAATKCKSKTAEQVFTANKLTWLERITRDQRLSHLQMRVVTLISFYMNWRKSGDAFPGQRELAGALDVTTRAVQLAQEALEGLGYLRIEVGNGPGNTNKYFPIFERNGEQPFVLSERKWRTAAQEMANPGAGNGERPFVQNTYLTPMEPSFKRTEKRESDRKTEWPDGFSLNDKMINIAAEKGFSRGQAEQMFEAFESHHRGLGSRREDWVYAWKGWVIRRVEIDAKSNTRAETDRNYIDGRL